MKVLFICSGNLIYGVSPITKNQGNSLERKGINVFYFTVNGKGIKSYIKSIKPLRKHLASNNYDIIHAHYSFSGILAVLAGAKPLVVSLMGSDVKSSSWFRFFLFFFYKYKWQNTIVKSEDMKQSLGFSYAEVVPNGVNTKLFYPINKSTAREKLNWPQNSNIILFPSDTSRPEKNYALLQSALKHLNEPFMIKSMVNILNDEVVYYYNAADVVVLPSLWEGSPNAVKEALACNRPIVATPVGDVPLLLSNVKGTFICDFQAEDLAQNIMKAFKCKNSDGKKQIDKLGISSDLIAGKLIQTYRTILNR